MKVIQRNESLQRKAEKVAKREPWGVHLNVHNPFSATIGTSHATRANHKALWKVYYNGLWFQAPTPEQLFLKVVEHLDASPPKQKRQATRFSTTIDPEGVASRNEWNEFVR